MALDKFKTKADIFAYIAKSSTYGNLGLFIGAGLPMAILNSDWVTVALSWKELIYKISEELSINFDEINKEGASYPEIASAICRKYAKKENIKYEAAVIKFKKLISNHTSWYPETADRLEYSAYFESLSPNWIITTNYDLIIESILTGKGYSLTPDDQMVAPTGLIPVYHLHGIRTNPDSIIITQEDYVSLFRPNQYRQQKLPLTLKESVTLLIGYNLGDFNVLTAVDWSRNVFSEQKISYPQDIIQFYFTEEPQTVPYRDTNKIIIIEFDNLAVLLKELSEFITSYKSEFEKNKKEIEGLNNFLKSPSEEIAEKFIDDETFRREILTLLKNNDNYLINGFLELFSKSIDITWERAKPNGAFAAYNENLKILLDTLEYLNIKSMPPALVESLAYNLNGVAYYIGNSAGQSYEANNTWNNRHSELSSDTKDELLNIARARQYYKLKNLLK